MCAHSVATSDITQPNNSNALATRLRCEHDASGTGVLVFVVLARTDAPLLPCHLNAHAHTLAHQHTSCSSAMDEWITIQQNTFTNWVNAKVGYLASRVFGLESVPRCGTD